VTGVQTDHSFNLFSSEAYAPAKNLMFKDSTVRLLRVPPNTDSFLYLGANYMSIVPSLKKEQALDDASPAIRWCAVGHAETVKCDIWSINSVSGEGGTTSIEWQSAPSVEEWLKKIMRKEADAVAV
ncbi:hypothetical protein, partial [Acinetobacter baumannii]|uniref:hypothetical protein n=1 Tax=Acinetobacter baumannii TaxID=470 RepID=UPI00148A4F89